MNFKKLFLPIILAVGAAPLLTSCGKTDYVSQCKLTDFNIQTYQGKNFLDNGIGQVEVKKYVDGDTTHFNQKEEAQRLVKVRYLGVDTPESTGQIEPWGKAASNFTKEKLSAAKTIVLTSDVNIIGNRAETDSTGSRFKAFVWISEKADAPVEDLRCLNLLLVQEGYSTGKGMSGSPLTDYFTKADLQAQELKLHIWSPKDDPDYYKGPAVETTLKELANYYYEDGVESSFNGAKIAVEGIVCKRSGDYDAYLCDVIDGVEYGLYVFAGYKSYSPLITLGNRIKIIGNYTIFMGNPQLTNVSYNSFLPGPDDMKVISRNNEYSVEKMTVEQLSKKEAINTIVEVENLTCYKGSTEIDKTTLKPSGALTLRCKDENQNDISVRIPEDVWVTPVGGTPGIDRVKDWEYFNGATVSLIGCVNFFAPDESDPDYGYYQVKLCVSSDFTIVSLGANA